MSSWCLFAIFDVITDSGILDKKRWGPWRRGCEAFLCAVPGSSKPYTARSHQYNILYVCWFVCLDMWNIWISRPKVQMACRAHVQIKTTGAQGIESALGEMSPNYMVLDNVTIWFLIINSKTDYSFHYSSASRIVRTWTRPVLTYSGLRRDVMNEILSTAVKLRIGMCQRNLQFNWP